MKIFAIIFFAVAFAAGFALLLAICMAAAKRPPMNSDDRKEFDDHDC